MVRGCSVRHFKGEDMKRGRGGEREGEKGWDVGILIVPMHYFSHREWERERRECHHASGIIYCFRGVMKNICILYVNIHSFALS